MGPLQHPVTRTQGPGGAQGLEGTVGERREIGFMLDHNLRVQAVQGIWKKEWWARDEKPGSCYTMGLRVQAVHGVWKK